MTRLLAGVIFVSGLTACNATNFSASKSEALAQSNVLGGGTSGTVVQPGGTGGNITQPGTTPSPSPNPQPSPSPVSGQVPQPATIPVTLDCSDDDSSAAASNGVPNFQDALSAGDSISLLVNGKVCTSDSTVITRLLESSAAQRQITVASLQAICPSVIPAQVTCKQSSTTSSFDNQSFSLNWFSSHQNGGSSNTNSCFASNLILSLTINGNVQTLDGQNLYSTSSSLKIVWAWRTADHQNDKNGDQPINTVTTGINQYCTDTHSPLMIHLPRAGESRVALNLSPATGIFFDLLGASDNHRKVFIDWVTNLDYRFLALPNAQGQVNGIDQLFGDQTTGPDGKTAANGYAALAKYDLNHDGRIDQNDGVFSQLRVWLDSNFDGVAQPEELVSLEQVGITFIDLDYSKSYPETDAFGNQIRMKSVVGRNDGSLNLIFDLWFAYTNP